MFLTTYGYDAMLLRMRWTILFDTAFERDFAGLAEEVQDELLAHAKLLETFGPQLGRPHVETLNGSKHANMKELRFNRL